MATNYTLRTGAMYNKVTPGFGPSTADAARYQFNSDAAGAAAGQLTDPNSVVGSATKAVLQGLQIGQGGKAKIAQAQAQDQYNNYVKAQTDYAQKLQEAQQRVSTENTALDQIAMPMGTAVMQYAKDGSIDALRSNQQRLANNWAQQAGYQMTNFAPTENDPYSFTVSMLDPTTGETDSHQFNVSDLVGRAMKQNAEFGQGFAQSLGINPDALKKPSESLQKLADFQKIKATEGEDAAYAFTGIKKPGDDDVQAAKEFVNTNRTDIAKLGTGIRSSGEAISRIDQGVESLAKAAQSGFRTGGATGQLKAQAANEVNSALNTKIFDVSDFENFNSNTIQAMLDVAKALYPVSNRDAETLKQSIASNANSPEGNLKIFATMRAMAIRNQDLAKTFSQGYTGQRDAWLQSSDPKLLESYLPQAQKEVVDILKRVQSKGGSSAAPAASAPTATSQPSAQPYTQGSTPAQASPDAAQSILQKYNIQ